MALDGSALWETLAREAEAESALWAAALRPADDREPVTVFSSLTDARFAFGLETVYEGYLAHYGRPRLFEAASRDEALLLGDYLYAHGLVRVAALGETAAVGNLSELLALCARLRGDGAPGDGVAWAATAALLAATDERLGAARAALSDRGDSEPLARLAAREAGETALARALALHADRVD
ncbi:MAG TPA: hypothetical protein VG079_08120 [Gaiellaceae bacterium]|nr:hypothetical protein [Gaiellaceae bacterium]